MQAREMILKLCHPYRGFAITLALILYNNIIPSGFFLIR
jgi:hypothetical protein